MFKQSSSREGAAGGRAGVAGTMNEWYVGGASRRVEL